MDTILINFHGKNISAIDIDGQPWFTAAMTGAALGYDNVWARQTVNSLYNKHRDEFSDADARLVELNTNSGRQQTRVFSLSGFLLLNLLTSLRQGKQFRQWAKGELQKSMEQQPAICHQPRAQAAKANPIHRLLAHCCRYYLKRTGQGNFANSDTQPTA